MDFHFFSQEGWKNFRWGVVICNMPFLMVWEGHEMANQSVPGGVKRHSSGVNHFLEGLRKIWREFNPPPP